MWQCSPPFYVINLRDYVYLARLFTCGIFEIRQEFACLRWFSQRFSWFEPFLNNLYPRKGLKVSDTGGHRRCTLCLWIRVWHNNLHMLSRKFTSSFTQTFNFLTLRVFPMAEVNHSMFLFGSVFSSAIEISIF